MLLPYRVCVLISVDDTFVFRYGTDIAYTSKAKQPMTKHGDHNKDWRTDHSPEYATD